MIIPLDDNKKVGIFKSLANKTFYVVGVEFGFDKYYKSPASIKAAVYNVYREVFNHPEKFGLHLDTIDLVTTAVKGRGIAHSAPKPTPTLAEQNEDTLDIKDLITSNRDLAGRLVRKKLIYLNKSKKALDSISLPQLATSFAILFDKGQIIQGQATEHVALLSRSVDSNMKPAEAIEAMLKMREMSLSEKGK